MNEIEKEIVVEHFKGELALYIHNSETCCNNGLRKIYANKAHWLALLLELSKKQLSESVLIKKATEYPDEDFYCPICKNQIASKIDGDWYSGMKQKYCENCGQALDWSDVE